ncbi:MAG: hypothetical protein WA063_00110 [Minisyncoccia bacterium]
MPDKDKLLKKGKRALHYFFLMAISSFVVYFVLLVQAGSLTPPGAVSSTMHSMQEVYDVLAGSFEANTFTGTGLDDMSIGGTFTGSTDLDYRIEIDAEGSPDTFSWSDSGGSTWDATGVAITGSAQTLNSGVTVTFGAATGHTLAERWDFSTESLAKSDGNVMGSLKCITDKLNGGICD